MDIVAALEAQHFQREYGNASTTSENDIQIGGMEGSKSTSVSPKETRKAESKKRWKNWGWKYSPNAKNCSIEEEPESPKRNSRHSSPTNSPKNSKNESPSASSVLANLITTSPLRRKTQSINGQSSQSTASRVDNRSSAGARLYQMLEDGTDESGEELQALLANGRPASVHIVPMSSATKSLLNNEV